ncbi:MAG: hypothetical protein ACK5JT_16320 [Hyphomicrobiaceae bacterium]
MHTVIVIASGLVLLALLVLTGPFMGVTRRRAALWFIPIWLVFALFNMLVGVFHAGYTFAQETPILAVVFGVPAIVAAVTAWRS